MRIIGWITIFIGVVNLLCLKFLSGFSFTIVGALIIFLQNKKEGYEKDAALSSKRNNKSDNNSSLNSSFPTIIIEAKIVESILKTDFTSWEERDVIETVASFKRWATGQECRLEDVKTNFLASFKNDIGEDFAKDMIKYLVAEGILKESIKFNIKGRNTCSHYMVKWIEELSAPTCLSKEKESIKFRNRKSARQLIIEENSEIEFINIPNKETIGFVCGSKKGYVTPAVKAKLDTITVEELQYAECAKYGTENWVPIIMMTNVIKRVDINTPTVTSADDDTDSCDLPF